MDILRGHQLVASLPSISGAHRWPSAESERDILYYDLQSALVRCTYSPPTTSPDRNLPFSNRIAPASAWIPLLYDTTVITLVIVRTLPTTRKRRVAFRAIGTEMLREGIAYYSVVFAVTFALTLMIAFADPGIKNICAQ